MLVGDGDSLEVRYRKECSDMKAQEIFLILGAGSSLRVLWLWVGGAWAVHLSSSATFGHGYLTGWDGNRGGKGERRAGGG